MKVLYYTHTYFLDSDLPLIEELIKKDVDVVLVIDLPYYQLKSTLLNLSRQIPQTGIMNVTVYTEFEFVSHYIAADKVYVLNRPGKVYKFSNILLRRNFAKFIDKYNPDILHCTDFIDLPDLFLYKYRKKLLQAVHDPFPHSGENTFKKRLLRNIEYKITKDYVLFNAKQRKKFVSQNHLEESHVHQASLGVFSWLHEYKNENKILDTTGYILFYGRFSPYKGIEYLIQAVDAIHDNFQNINLVIAGGGALYFEELIQGKSYIKVINKYLSMAEIYSLISNCKFVVCPYVDATQSGVVMSSFALGKVVVGTAVGGLPEMLGYGNLGPIVPPKNVGELAIALSNLLENKQELYNYELNIKDACTSTKGLFSWQNIAEKYVNIYKSMINDTVII